MALIEIIFRIIVMFVVLSIIGYALQRFLGLGGEKKQQVQLEQQSKVTMPSTNTKESKPDKEESSKGNIGQQSRVIPQNQNIGDPSEIKLDKKEKIITEKEQIREIHIYIQGGGDADVGLEIVKSLRPNCLSQAIKPKITMHNVGGEWPSEMFHYAFGNLMRQGIKLSTTNCLVENGSAFGKKIYVVYLKNEESEKPTPDNVTKQSESKDNIKDKQFIKVQGNEKGQALKDIFGYIRANYPDGEFKVNNIPGVNENFLQLVKRETKDVNWISSSPKQYAIETLLTELHNMGLLNRRDAVRNEYGDLDIYFSLSPRGKVAELVYQTSIVIWIINERVILLIVVLSVPLI